MRRLYFLVPDPKLAKSIVDELLLAGVEAGHIHVIAKEHHVLVDEDLPEATLAQSSDLIPSLERGAAVGGATGALAGLAAVTLPTGGLALGGAAVLWLTLAGAGLGSFFSSLIGVSAPNSRLKAFGAAIEKGELLILVDVPAERSEEFAALVRRHHPEAEIYDTEPSQPPR